MNQRPNPIHRKGDRNALCPHYGVCLDKAVKKSWETWDCSRCLYKGSRDPSLSVLSAANDSDLFYDLSVRVDSDMYWRSKTAAQISPLKTLLCQPPILPAHEKPYTVIPADRTAGIGQPAIVIEIRSRVVDLYFKGSISANWLKAFFLNNSVLQKLCVFLQKTVSCALLSCSFKNYNTPKSWVTYCYHYVFIFHWITFINLHAFCTYIPRIILLHEIIKAGHLL